VGLLPWDADSMAIDEVVRLDLPWTPDPGAPLPLLWQADGDAVVIYHPSFSTGRGGERVVLRFGRCMIAVFGYPNDEALGGHPLFEHGLGFYDIFEVLNSSWIQRLRDQNLVNFPGIELAGRDWCVCAVWRPDGAGFVQGPKRMVFG